MPKRVFSQVHAVAGAVIEKDGKILLMQEAWEGPDKGKWNQPAGWIELGEDPVAAVKKEVREETGYAFTPTALLGVYSIVRNDTPRPDGYPHGIKLIFVGNIDTTRTEPLSADSSRVGWFTPDEIYAMDAKTLRDADIKKEVKDYFDGRRFPLDIVRHTVAAP